MNKELTYNLRADEIADLDPYEVRSKPVKTSAENLLYGEMKEKEDCYGIYFNGSAFLQLAMVMQEKGFDGIKFKETKADLQGTLGLVFINHHTKELFQSMLQNPDIQILCFATNPNSNELNFYNGEYEEFKNPITRERLKILKKEYEITGLRAAERISGNNNEDLIKDARKEQEEIIKGIQKKIYFSGQFIPTHEEVKRWISEIVDNEIAERLL